MDSKKEEDSVGDMDATFIFKSQSASKTETAADTNTANATSAQYKHLCSQHADVNIECIQPSSQSLLQVAVMSIQTCSIVASLLYLHVFLQ